MALLKSSKVRDFADAELKAKLFEYQKELNSERGLLASGGRTSNPGKLRELRKTIARIITIMHERKLGLVRGAAKKAAQAAPAKK
ncbi:50S ribosomal protein L29 [uncultured archaeon]|nr:50S ribosomal protein L29 [uncultured archaeon]